MKLDINQVIVAQDNNVARREQEKGVLLFGDWLIYWLSISTRRRTPPKGLSTLLEADWNKSWVESNPGKREPASQPASCCQIGRTPQAIFEVRSFVIPIHHRGWFCWMERCWRGSVWYNYVFEYCEWNKSSNLWCTRLRRMFCLYNLFFFFLMSPLYWGCGCHSTIDYRARPTHSRSRSISIAYISCPLRSSSTYTGTCLVAANLE